MNSKMLKIALASASGAVIGYGLSTMFLAGIWTLVASLFGGLIGWVLYDLRGFFSSMRSAFISTACSSSTWSNRMSNVPWKAVFSNALKEALKIFVPVLPMCTVGMYAGYAFCGLIELGNNSLGSLLLLYSSIFALGLLAAVGEFLSELLKFETRPSHGPDLTLKYVIVTSPPVLPFVALYFIVKGTIRYTPPIIGFAWLFVVNTFVFAHNNGRLACALGAGIGTLVGVLAGYMLIAMLSGAVIGVSVAFIGSLVPRDYVQGLTRSLAAYVYSGD